MSASAPLPDPERVIAALTFLWTAPDDAVWQTSPILESAPQAPAQRYLITVTRNGDQVGISRRNVRTSAEFGQHVEQILLNIDEAFRGGGFGTAYWRHCLREYAALGLHHVVLTADDDGRLFWARDPVRFDTPDKPRMLLRSMERDGAGRAEWPAFSAAAAGKGISAEEATA